MGYVIAGLVGTTPWEEALHDMFLENIMEPGNKIMALYYWMVFQVVPQPDDGKQQVEAAKDFLCKSLGYIQSVMEKRATKFLVTNQVRLL